MWRAYVKVVFPQCEWSLVHIMSFTLSLSVNNCLSFTLRNHSQYTIKLLLRIGRDNIYDTLIFSWNFGQDCLKMDSIGESFFKIFWGRTPTPPYSFHVEFHLFVWFWEVCLRFYSLENLIYSAYPTKWGYAHTCLTSPSGPIRYSILRCFPSQSGNWNATKRYRFTTCFK